MRYWSHNPELLDEITIENLPEPHKTWCELGEKPFPKWKVLYRFLIYKFLRTIERTFPKSRSDVKLNYGKTNILSSWSWYPYGAEYYTSDVPDNILFPAMDQGIQDYWDSKADRVPVNYPLRRAGRLVKKSTS